MSIKTDDVRMTRPLPAIISRLRLMAGAAIIFSSVALFSAEPALANVRIEVGFSPEGSAQQLVLKTIQSARKTLRLMGYSFTSPEVAKALIAAHKRGVDVKVVLDDKGNQRRANWAAMNLLVNAGIPLRTIRRYDITHDKVIIVDNATVETGSFNYSRSAARYNSENVVVLHNVPAVAQQYLRHWQSRWDQGKDWHLGY